MTAPTTSAAPSHQYVVSRWLKLTSIRVGNGSVPPFEAMKFVNQDEDPKLTRLAAERYTQFKLNQLS